MLFGTEDECYEGNIGRGFPILIELDSKEIWLKHIKLKQYGGDILKIFKKLGLLLKQLHLKLYFEGKLKLNQICVHAGVSPHVFDLIYLLHVDPNRKLKRFGISSHNKLTQLSATMPTRALYCVTKAKGR